MGGNLLRAVELRARVRDARVGIARAARFVGGHGAGAALLGIGTAAILAATLHGGAEPKEPAGAPVPAPKGGAASDVSPPASLDSPTAPPGSENLSEEMPESPFVTGVVSPDPESTATPELVSETGQKSPAAMPGPGTGGGN